MSRLDRLVVLLDTGSSSFIRNTAADQLAAVQKAHPEDLLHLLSRVLPYLRSRKWDSRVAAGRAIGGIVANAPLWDPNANGFEGPYLQEEEAKPKIEELDDQLRVQIKTEDDAVLGERSAPPGHELTFANLDLRTIIENGTKLLGSGGAEYDEQLHADPAAQLARQRQSLRSRLGFGGEYVDDVVDDTDLDATSLVAKKASRSPTPVKVEVKAEEPETPKGNARMLAMARRRAKAGGKAANGKVRVVDGDGAHAQKTDGFSVTSQAHTDKVVVEHKVAKVSALVQMQDPLRWPFEAMCDLLLLDLFNEAWEVRHGAAIGLREVIRVHGAGAGRVMGRAREQNTAANRRWLEDLACRFCCIFALDRFGDYVADQVVAPVRESTAQVMAALLVHMPADLVYDLFAVLRKLVLQNEFAPAWEVCHAGMMGMRYLVSIRTDILLSRESCFEQLIECVLRGLKEGDDDVQAMAAATMLPIAGEFVAQRAASIADLLDVIWTCVAELKDDLSSSIGSFMDLLAKLCTYPQVLEVMKQQARQDKHKAFSHLVPRLYPFLRHSITSVRKAVLRALQTFLTIGSDPASLGWLDTRILRLLFQNLLVEQNEAVLDLSVTVFNELIAMADVDMCLAPCLHTLVELLMTPIGAARKMYPMDKTKFIRPSGIAFATAEPAQDRGSTKRKRNDDKTSLPVNPELAHAVNQVNIDNLMFSGDVSLVGFSVFLRTRVAASVCLGNALGRLSSDAAHLDFTPYLTSPFSSQQLCCGLTLEEYGKSCKAQGKPVSPNIVTPQVLDALTTILSAEIADVPMYRECVPFLKVVRTQTQALFNVFVDIAHLSRAKLPQLPVIVQGEAVAGPDAFNLSHAENIVNVVYEKLKKSLTTSNRVSAAQALQDGHRSLLHAFHEAEDAKNSRFISVQAAAAAAVVSVSSLPKKLNPIIRALINSIKAESNEQLQDRVGASVAKLAADLYQANKVSAADKMVKNMCAFLCADTTEVPQFSFNEKVEDSILSLKKEDSRADTAESAELLRQSHAAMIKRHGGLVGLSELSALYGGQLFDSVPKIKECMFASLDQLKEDYSPNNDMQADQAQSIIDALSVIRALLPRLDPSLHAQFILYLPLVLQIMTSKYAVLRYTAAKCFATICDVITVEGISVLVKQALPMMNNSHDLHARQGATECIYHLTNTMKTNILPYVVFLIVPVLGRMSDSDKDIRLIATTTFASIIKLVPLERDIPDPPNMSKELLAGREKEREFISQMMDVSKIEPFPLPVAIKAELRKYQQEGVNWLAFLNKYHLHGILCDDMGLGKTLQTICMVASDHYLREQEHKKTGSMETRKLPSLIVCPPTLTGHWQHELRQYAPFLKVLIYVGVPSVRSQIAKKFASHDIVVTSYDITRNDRPVVAAQPWNYVVLDEGHVIKNSASKLTQAVKTLVANHRLILSGTPIQNNVLELWSLFDFLMPGFLGTEKVFNDRFAKPIAASRNSKSSSKEQEAGALALEALHKQALPFLLRRLKEDVLSDLPPKIIQDYYCDLSDLQKRLYENFAKKQKSTVENEVQDLKESKQHIFQALQYMRKLCNHPALVMNPKHPQYNAVMKDLAASKRSIHDIAHAPKLVALQTLLNDCGIGDQSSNAVTSQHRALIFCQLKDMLDMVENDLLKKHMPSVSYMRLDGSTEAHKRQDIVQQFNDDPSIDVLLLTTHVGGLGLNLTGADTVIFVEHDWNPMNDLQAMDRAHRIGQRKVVNVYRLITRNTLEEKIMGLQKFKLNIASTIINQQNSGLNSMDTDQILDLFDVPNGDGLAAGANGKPEEESAAGQIKGPGAKAIGELGELWDEKEYDEEYNLDNFIQTLK